MIADQQAHDGVWELQLDIDAEESFVPAEDARRKALRGTRILAWLVLVVSAETGTANAILGQRSDGQHSRLWLELGSDGLPLYPKGSEIADPTDLNHSDSVWALETVKFAGDGEDSELFTAIPHVMDAQLIADDLKEEPGYMTTGFDSMVVSWFDLEHFEEDRCAKPDTSMVGWFDLEHCDQDFECHGSGFDIDMHHQLYMPVGCNPDKIHHSRVTSSPAAEHDSSEGKEGHAVTNDAQAFVQDKGKGGKDVQKGDKGKKQSSRLGPGDTTFSLDPTDWDAPVIPTRELGERFNKLEGMAAGSKLLHSLTLVMTGKKGDECIPGRLDEQRHLIMGSIHKVLPLKAAQHLSPQAKKRPLNLQDSVYCCVCPTGTHLCKVALAGLYTVAYKGYHAVGDRHSPGEQRLGQECLETVERKESSLNLITRIVEQYALASAGFIYDSKRLRHPEKFNNWGTFQDMNACIHGLERSFYRYCASESIELITAAHDGVWELQLDIDAEESFVPAEDARRKALRGTRILAWLVLVVSAETGTANAILGQRSDGQHSRLWLELGSDGLPLYPKGSEIADPTDLNHSDSVWALETVKFAGDGEDSELFTAIPHVMDAQLIADDLKEEPGYMTTGFDSMVVSWFDLEHFEEDRCAKPDTSMVGWFDLEHCDQDFECHGSGFDIDMHHQLYMPVGCNPDKIHHSRVTSSPAAEHDSSEGKEGHAVTNDAQAFVQDKGKGGKDVQKGDKGKKQSSRLGPGDTTFSLDPTDWDAPVIPTRELGERFNKLEGMAAGSKLLHSLTLVMTGKKGDECIPGRLDEQRHLIMGSIHKVLPLKAAQHLSPQAKKRPLNLQDSVYCCVCPTGTHLCKVALAGLYTVAYKGYHAVGDRHSPGEQRLGQECLETVERKESSLNLITRIVEQYALASAGFIYDSKRLRHPEKFNNWGTFQDMNACIHGLERSFYRYCASESIELITADTPSQTAQIHPDGLVSRTVPTFDLCTPKRRERSDLPARRCSCRGSRSFRMARDRLLAPYLEIRETKSKGRGVFAASRIPRFEAVLTVRIWAVALALPARPFRCRSCFRASGHGALQACSVCGEAYFCATCRQSAETEEKHRHECLLLQRLEGFSSKEVPTEVRANVALLISLHAFLQTEPRGNVSDLLDLVQEPLSRPGARRRARLRAAAAKLFLEILEETETAETADKKAERSLYAAEVLTAALAALPLNAFGLGPEGRDGHGLAPAASYINHSCVPNCVEQIGEGCVRFFALRDIEPGEEITFAYLDLSLPLEDRKRLVKTRPGLLSDFLSVPCCSWDFSCDCARCRLGTRCAEVLAFDEEHLCQCGAVLLRKEKELCRCEGKPPGRVRAREGVTCPFLDCVEEDLFMSANSHATAQR
ncbi:hypothetical protein AK812_SmicGene35402 [Symbiodinium microadriaticum]|uniref:SET domain-containing protein n=1 Tax=Symbiodinium microadriaticum TaxID=2951 RepID=A0A1Q9CLJ0_SYMMI|nr:hypothetical protein AK812_SmicGene35402 [Symbiodinium microadriaticum]